MKRDKVIFVVILLAASFSMLAFDSNIRVQSGDTGNRTDHALSTGRVLDAVTNSPLKGAIVTINSSEVIQTNENGLFPVKSSVYKIAVRAHGYTRAEMEIAAQPSISPVEIKLNPFKPKALYLTVYGIGDRTLRNSALKYINETELNSLVIDMKGDRGIIPYKSSLPLASQIGAQRLIILKDINGTMQFLKERGIYTIARIVVFKDNLLGTARPDLAVKTHDGHIWKDREGLIWVDPSKKEVWDYNIDIAIEAAKNGFDEIQFDYVRFPDHKGLAFGIPNTEENRVKSISGFLMEAKRRLAPYNVFIAADIFGYAAWNLNDTQIGQSIEHLSHIDYISLMLYPSGFHLGIPGYRNPVANSNRIVYLSLKRAEERTNLPTIRFRPWLQAFKDYAFDRRHFTGVEIREQIKAVEDFGSNGWMLWNPRNVYTADGLQKKAASIRSS